MFTGLVEDTGIVVSAERATVPWGPGGSASDAVAFTVRPQRIALADLAVGESVCHNGCCLSVTEVSGDAYRVFAGAETLSRTMLGRLAAGARVNLERSLRVGDRLGGHWVTGHIDGTGELATRTDLGSNLVLRFTAPPALLRYVVEKGSIALSGVSLTINAVDAESFSVALIPITRELTNLGELAVGDRVNLEVDILAKHVEKLVKS